MIVSSSVNLNNQSFGTLNSNNSQKVSQKSSDKSTNQFIINTGIGLAGAVAGWEAEPVLKRFSKKPFSKLLIKLTNFKFNDVQGGGYKEYIENAIKQQNLEGKVKLVDLNERNYRQVMSELGFKPVKCRKLNKIIAHILRLGSHAKDSFMRTVYGTNAFFSPKKNAVVCNFEKFGAPVFHELSHKLNSISKNPFLRMLSKVRSPLAVFAPLGISACAVFTDKEKNSEKQDKSVRGFVKNHCGILTGLATLPLVTEECIANIRGTKIAKQAGVSGEMLAKVVKAHKFSAISYIAGIPIVVFASWGANKIRDLICSQKIQDK